MAGRSSRALLEIADSYVRKHYDELIALAWQGYQQHGRGVVLLNPEERPGAWTEAKFYPWGAIAHLPSVKADQGLKTLVTTCDLKEMRFEEQAWQAAVSLATRLEEQPILAETKATAG